MTFYLERAYGRVLDEFGPRAAVICDPRRPDMPIVHATSDFFALTGYAPEDVIGRNCRFLQGPDTDSATVWAIGAAIRNGRAFTADLLNYRKDGSVFWNRLRIKPLMARDGALTRIVGVQNPVAPHEVRRELVAGFAE
ncbi:MAG: PAS domain-containing protein [Alphaproteobacteria bacterium]|nr:PAS domain-containing protein [Alphaproteobacteria bacterium]